MTDQMVAQKPEAGQDIKARVIDAMADLVLELGTLPDPPEALENAWHKAANAVTALMYDRDRLERETAQLRSTFEQVRSDRNELRKISLRQEQELSDLRARDEALGILLLQLQEHEESIVVGRRRARLLMLDTLYPGQAYCDAVAEIVRHGSLPADNCLACQRDGFSRCQASAVCGHHNCDQTCWIANADGAARHGDEQRDEEMGS